jgi:hypothetical protein
MMSGLVTGVDADADADADASFLLILLEQNRVLLIDHNI